MSIRDMFNIATRAQVFGIEGYEVPRKYIDPMKQIQDRDFFEKREKNKLPTKNNKYVTKRGHFQLDLEKQKSGKPGPGKYNLDYVWVSEQDKEKGKKKPHDTKRNTYIDLIIHESEKRPVPGAGKYNLRKTDEQIKKEQDDLKSKKIHQSEIVDFLCEYQFLSATTPGPGQYNGRPVTTKLQTNKTKPNDWINKHKTESKKRLKSAMPDVCSYNPFPSTYRSFGKLMQLNKEGTDKTKVNYFGKSQRFGNNKKGKQYITPGPGQYQLLAKWPGKEEGIKKDKTTKNWMYNLTKGTHEVKSIYY
ncbi:hypothetical protein IMG5_173130 [Ichthyophthirius multifiliis]|uniref:Uncharacterized protein n=1 Tax=Ichthyophthirius multifiliis TaxID=5932 RepID=G0R1V9_ICHMU|nr:hypothetical protein IMG5_173130 [Ichthyophthirius multifiliis]EGR28548.1 hypothetical protein IMG5_173130 [Ichthyophthirius multifiliis]|eukprot:XP_004029784.1 hypothetical protein IMG5_173130 [Ichthyophthirius multifiliis]